LLRRAASAQQKAAEVGREDPGEGQQGGNLSFQAVRDVSCSLPSWYVATLTFSPLVQADAHLLVGLVEPAELVNAEEDLGANEKLSLVSLAGPIVQGTLASLSLCSRSNQALAGG
jgi:hypothetical protein